MPNTKETAPTIETKQVKHSFTLEERDQLGDKLARAIGDLRGIDAEFDQVKASFKARITESETNINRLSTDRVNGFEYRMEKCVVVFRPTDRKKDYYLEADWKNGETKADPVATEDMTARDFEQDLIQAESKFDCREEINLFQPTEQDSGVLVVGRFADKWFSAVRIKIGKVELTERLDSEQKCFKVRPDAVETAVKRARKWLKENLKEHAKGFEASFDGVIEAHKEREE